MSNLLNPLMFYCISPALLRRSIGVNKTGGRTYDIEEEILVKKEEGNKEKFSVENRDLISNGVFYSIEEVKVGDMIDEKVIKGRSIERNIYGEIYGYKLYY